MAPRTASRGFLSPATPRDQLDSCRPQPTGITPYPARTNTNTRRPTNSMQAGRVQTAHVQQDMQFYDYMHAGRV